MRRLGLLAVLLLALSAAPAHAAPQFTDFTASSGDVATGAVAGTTVTVTGADVSSVAEGSVVDGTSSVFSYPAFTPQLPQSDFIQLPAAINTDSPYAITFGQPVTDPTLHLGSLASKLTFPVGTQLVRVSGDSQFGVSGNEVTGAIGGAGPPTDANGTIRVIGTFTSLNFTSRPVYTAGGADGIVIQVGAEPPSALAPRIWWKLDTYTGNPNGAAQTPDDSGNNHTGIATVFSPLITGRFGNAMRLPSAFQGFGSGIRTPDSPAFETPAITAMLWVRHLGVPAGGSRLLSNADNGAGSGWRVTIDPGGDVTFAGAAQTGIATAPAIPASRLWDGAWHGIAITYDGSTGRSFVDGVQIGGGSAGQGPLVYPVGGRTGPNVGGTQGGADDSHPEVDVDDFRLYTGALSPADAQYLTNPLHIVSPSLPAQSLPNVDLVARYHLDEIGDQGVQSTETLGTRDSSGHGHHGREVQATLTGGRFLNAFGPGGFRAASTAALRPERATVMAYVRATGPQTGMIAGYGEGTCSQTFALRADGDLRFSVNQPAGGTVSVPIPAAQVFDGQWHAIAGVVSHPDVEVWMDGTLRGSTTYSADATLLDYDNGAFFEVGRQAGCSGDAVFGGTLDEVRLYDRRLSAQEIGYLQHPLWQQPPDLPVGPTPTPTPTPSPTPTVSPSPTPVVCPGDATPTPVPSVTATPSPTVSVTATPTATSEPEPDLQLKWHLDGCNRERGQDHSGKVYDASGNGLHGTIGDGAFFGPGRFGSAFALPRQPQGTPGIDVPDEGGEGPVLQTEDVTMMFWMRGAPPQGIVNLGQYGDGCSNYAYAFLGSADSLSFSVQNTDIPIPRSSEVARGTFDGQWHAIVGSYDGERIRIYVDGAQVGTGQLVLSQIDYSRLTDPALHIGGGSAPEASCQGLLKPFRGDVDELRVYSRALSPEEVGYLSGGYHRRPPRLPVPAGPKNTARPTLSGVPRLGSTLTCNPGAWTPAPINREYLWERAPRNVTVDGDDAWFAIDGATGTTFTIPNAPEFDSARIRCREIAYDAATSEEAVSRSLRIDADVPMPVASSPPTLTTDGVFRSGRPITCNRGEWTGNPDESEFRYQWFRENTSQPIAGATGRTFTPLTEAQSANDFEHTNVNIFCSVTASNDVGAGGVAESAPRFVIDGPPRRIDVPKITFNLPTNTPNPLQLIATCDKGRWADAYADRPFSTGGLHTQHPYRYQWFRADTLGGEPAPIAGAIESTFEITADQLGRYILCRVMPSNPLGESTWTAAPQFIPLPVPTRRVIFESVFRNNPNDPLNMTAIDVEYRDHTAEYARQLLAAQRFAEYRSCERGQVTILDRIREMERKLAALPPAGQRTPEQSEQARGLNLALGFNRTYVIPDAAPPVKQRGDFISFKQRCWILLRDFQKTQATPFGVQWQPPGSNCVIGAAGANAAQACVDLGMALQPAIETNAPALTAQLRDQIAARTPLRLLWDINGDNRTDISCPGSAPVLRSNLVRGFYNVSVVIVDASSEATGQFAGIRQRVDFPFTTQNNPGNLLEAGPKWCRTSMVPPPDPDVGPCTTEATVGAIKLQGNLCPINVRAIPSGQILGLPQPIQDVIKKAADAINEVEAIRDLQQPGASAGTRASLLAPVFRAATAPEVAGAALNTAATIGAVDQARAMAAGAGSQAEQALAQAFNLNQPNNPPQLVTEKAQFALDQIYSANAVGSNGINGVGGVAGVMKVNGVSVNPLEKNLNTIIAPSSVEQGVKGLQLPNMEIFSPRAISALGDIPLAPDPQRFKAVLSEKINQEKDKAIAQGINFLDDKFKQYAKNFDLGPFKLTGADVKVTANPDGTATLDATASLPGITSASAPRGSKDPAGGAITTAVKLKGDLSGRVQLQGLSLSVPKAFLIGVQLEKLKLDYNADAGLNVGGIITFPLSGGQGIEVIDFKLDKEGKFAGTKVNYLAGAGLGVQVAPGVFITKIGGGFSADPFEIVGNAAVSAGPSAGGGCPTVGIDGGVTVHFSPQPIFLQVKGQVVLVCIPLVDFEFYADENGWIKASADMDLEIPAIVELSALIKGELKIPEGRWQVGARGEASFPYLPLPDLTMKGTVSNLGMAACASITIDLLIDEITLAAGAGVKFLGGVPPISPVQLIAGFRAFLGCDLGAYSPLFAVRVNRQVDAPQVFTLRRGTQSLSFEGVGGAPRVKLISPSGKEFDFTDAVGGKQMEGAFGTIIEAEDRTVAILAKAEAGNWRAELAPGSVPIARIQQADILTDPTVKAKVSGKGDTRTLTYDVKPIAGQEVTFVETANGGHNVLKTVKRGGKGKVRYRLEETRSAKRTVKAMVYQDGLPREQFAVDRFVAANPKLRAPRVKVRRKGTRAVVTWKKVAGADYYDVAARFADGRNLVFEAGRKPTLTIPAVGKKDGVVVRVTASTLSGRQATGTGRLKTVKKKKAKPRKRK